MNTTIAKEQDTSSALPEHRFFGSSKKKRLLLALSLFTVTLVVYNPVIHFQFLNYDDPEYVAANQHVQQGLHWGTIGWALTTFEFYNWHPLTWITFLMDYQLFKLTPAGYHSMNVLYHAVAVVLLFLTLHLGTNHAGRSFCVATLFALHPFNVESVAWIAERKNVLSAMFWFGAIWAYGWYAIRPGWKRYLILVSCFALGLMAKPMVVTLPCVLLLLDVWPLRRTESPPPVTEASLQTKFNFARKSWPALVLEKIPLFILSAISGVITLLAQRYGGAIRNIAAYPVGLRIANAVVSYVLYVYKTFVPYKLAVFYPHPGPSLSGWKVAVSTIILLAITLTAIRLRHQRPHLIVGWLWFLVTLAPVIGLFQNGDQAMADRYAYTPLIGLFVMSIWEADRWLQNRRIPRWVAASLAGVLICVLIAVTRHQLGYWRDSITLFSHAIDVTQENAIAEANLGVALYNEGRASEAATHFANAVRYNGNSSANHYNYGHSLLVAGKPQEAIEQFTKVVQPGPSQSKDPHLLTGSHYQLGLAYIRIGNSLAAEDELQKAIQMDPSHYEAPLQLGLLYQKQNRCEEAMAPLALSLHMRKSNAGLMGLGTCLEQQHKFDEARTVFEEAVKISPDYEPARIKLREVDGLLAKRKKQ